MTRLESAARDYAIACLSGRGGDITAANALEMVSLLQPAGALRDAEPWRRAERDPQGVMRITWCGDRRVRARVALYLRLLRRVEAWDASDDPEWSAFDVAFVDSMEEPCARWPVSGPDWESNGADIRTVPWRPLWLDAPPYSADITARQRRGW